MSERDAETTALNAWHATSDRVHCETMSIRHYRQISNISSYLSEFSGFMVSLHNARNTRKASLMKRSFVDSRRPLSYSSPASLGAISDGSLPVIRMRRPYCRKKSLRSRILVLWCIAVSMVILLVRSVLLRALIADFLRRGVAVSCIAVHECRPRVVRSSE